MLHISWTLTKACCTLGQFSQADLMRICHKVCQEGHRSGFSGGGGAGRECQEAIHHSIHIYKKRCSLFPLFVLFCSFFLLRIGKGIIDINSAVQNQISRVTATGLALHLNWINRLTSNQASIVISSPTMTQVHQEYACVPHRAKYSISAPKKASYK